MVSRQRISVGKRTAALLSLVLILSGAAQASTDAGAPTVTFSGSLLDGQSATSFYRQPLSTSTSRDPDPPKYADRSSLPKFAPIDPDHSHHPITGLDLGLDTRFRFEYRDNDLRQPNQASTRTPTAFTTPIKRYEQTDHVLLQRTRFYLGIREIADPFRFAIEIADSRRYGGSDFRPVPTGDEINTLEPIRLYGEIHLKDLLGYDHRGNSRPFSIRYGIHNFEFLDRRIIANNQWRNTANAFQGFHGSIGQGSNDWSADLLAIQPLKRLEYDRDEVTDPVWVYGVIGHWRTWSDFITVEPFYFQRRNPRYIDAANRFNTARVVHSPGIRAYGTVPRTGFDFDGNLIPQFGTKGAYDIHDLAGTVDAGLPSATRAAERIRAVGYTAELGYTWKDHPWRPRLGAFYGFASGDNLANPTYGRSPTNAQDLTDNRFERFYGFQRPWSAQDYIVFENISAPKVRVEFQPMKDLRVDLGFGWFWLASRTDRYLRANSSVGTSRDPNGTYGSHIGDEFDIRARYALTQSTEITIGYSHFKAGSFTEKTIWSTPSAPNGRGDSNFAYIEISKRLF